MAHRPVTMLRSRAWLVISFCIVGLLGITMLTRKGATQGQRAQMPDDVREAKIRKAKNVAPSVGKVRKLLKDAHVPLEASDLFSPFWYRRVSVYSNVVPDLTKVKQGSNRLKGVVVADTLVLPEKIELAGDTLLIARQVVFAGRNIEIKGNHDLHFFQNAPVLSVDNGVQARGYGAGVRFEKVGFKSARTVEDAIARGLLVEPQTMSVSVDGYGREQWLEDQKKKKKEKDNLGLRAAHYRTAQQSQNGEDKTGTGAEGERGSPAVQPGPPPTQATGDCNTNPDGHTGDTGYTTLQAGTGHTGGTGDNGGNGGTLNWTVPQGSGYMTFSARGGGGQKGGRGGEGGLAAPGGQGGQGGPGKECDCPLRSGNGGRGGQGGQGGQGGNGGQGGTGGKGGDGGTINLTKPCDYTNYGTNVTVGIAGPGGDPGHYSTGAAGGPGGPGGTAATNAYCALQGGSSLGSGPQGVPGGPGDYDGDPGQNGEAGDNPGSVNTTNYGNCGGGGGGGDYTDLYPGGGFEQYCQPYDWVWIHCDWYADEEEAHLVRKYEPTVKASHYVRALYPKPPSWDCYEVARWPAGCF